MARLVAGTSSCASPFQPRAQAILRDWRKAMPSRSFFQVPDQAANALILADSVGEIDDNALKLISKGQAPLVNDGSLSLFLGISTEIIYSITTKKQKNYRRFVIKKGNGKFRFIDAPRTYLKVVQWWILDNILSSVQLPDYVTGFVRGRGIVSNAIRHVGMRHILNMDIANFFPPSMRRRCAGFLKTLGTHKASRSSWRRSAH